MNAVLKATNSKACQKILLSVLGDMELVLSVSNNDLFLGKKKVFSFADEKPDFKLFSYVFCIGEHRDYSKLRLLTGKIIDSLVSEKILDKAYNSLSQSEKDEVHSYYNRARVDQLLNQMYYRVKKQMMEQILESTIESNIYGWLDQNTDSEFVELIKNGFKQGSAISYAEVFTMQQCKKTLTDFFAKYPHMLPMLRAIREAHNSGFCDIFGTIKSIEDLERGEFLVEKYNQPKNYYNYSDAKFKFLADAQSWQWLLKQKPKFVNTIMKKYTVNDSGKKDLSYDGFSCIRENLSVITKLNLDEKLAFAILKDYSSSIDNDRFDIGVLSKKQGLETPEFHNGSIYLAKVKKVLEYFNEKGLTIEEQVKFINTLSESFSDIDAHLNYMKKHKKITDKSDLELIDEWVFGKVIFLGKLKKLKTTSYIPESLKFESGFLKEVA